MTMRRSISKWWTCIVLKYELYQIGIAHLIHSLPYRTLSESYLRRKISLKYIWLSLFSGLLRETHSPVQCEKSYKNSVDPHQNKSKHICIRDDQSRSSNLQTKKSHFAFNASGQPDMRIRVPHRMSTHCGVWRILRQHELNGCGRYVFVKLFDVIPYG